jgi:hypothetical protein
MVHLRGKVGTGPVQHAIMTLPNVGPKGEFHKEMGGAIYPPRRGARGRACLPALQCTQRLPAVRCTQRLPGTPCIAPAGHLS